MNKGDFLQKLLFSRIKPQWTVYFSLNPLNHADFIGISVYLYIQKRFRKEPSVQLFYTQTRADWLATQIPTSTLSYFFARAGPPFANFFTAVFTDIDGHNFTVFVQHMSECFFHVSIISGFETTILPSTIPRLSFSWIFVNSGIANRCCHIYQTQHHLVSAHVRSFRSICFLIKGKKTSQS